MRHALCTADGAARTTGTEPGPGAHPDRAHRGGLCDRRSRAARHPSGPAPRRGPRDHRGLRRAPPDRGDRCAGGRRPGVHRPRAPGAVHHESAGPDRRAGGRLRAGRALHRRTGPQRAPAHPEPLGGRGRPAGAAPAAARAQRRPGDRLLLSGGRGGGGNGRRSVRGGAHHQQHPADHRRCPRQRAARLRPRRPPPRRLPGGCPPSGHPAPTGHPPRRSRPLGQ